MHTYTLSHLSDAVLLRDLAALVAQDRLTTAALLAHIGEVDARRLYAPAGYPSMHAYCVGELRLSEDAALKRIQAARAGRLFPALLAGLADGRFHLSGIRLLVPHLTVENADELLNAMAFRRKSEIEEMLARRFGAPGVPALVRAIVPIPHACIEECDTEHAPGHVVNEFTKSGSSSGAHTGSDDGCGGGSSGACGGGCGELAASPVDSPLFEMEAASPERFLLQLTVGRTTHDKLRYAQALLSHALPSGDIAQVLERALDVLISQLEKRKFGASVESAKRSPSRASEARQPSRAERPRQARARSTVGRHSTPGSRYIPIHVRRAVWERDQGQCTFVSAHGHRCGARRFLEFDHADPVARGGGATVDGVRLRCRAHNQYEAERVFGEGFMAAKRREARVAVVEARALAREAAAQEAAAREAAKEATQDVFAGLRGLGCRAEEARRAAEFSQALHGAPIEERMRAALKFLGQRSIQGRSSAEAFAGPS